MRCALRRLVPLLLAATAAGSAVAQDTASGAAMFKQKCTTCHTEKKVLTGLRKTAPEERAGRLEKLLPGHFAPDATQRKAIADYLVTEAAKE